MTISNIEPLCYHAEPQKVVSAGGLSVFVGLGERAGLIDVVNLTITSGPVVAEMQLSPADARLLADHLADVAGAAEPDSME